MNLDLLKPAGLDFISVMVLKNCKPELSYILAEFFNMHLKKSCLPDCWAVGENFLAKNYHPVNLLSMVSKVFEKPLNNRFVDHLEKSGVFLIFSMVLGLLSEPQIF